MVNRIVAVEIATFTICRATVTHTDHSGIAAGRNRRSSAVHTVPRSAGATRNAITRGRGTAARREGSRLLLVVR